jgi:multidrug efflux pump subunit AcrB
MLATTLHEIVPVLQVATGPVILISGIGLLLLTMTNRLGRTIDRARQLGRELPETTGEKRDQTLTQITIIYRRAKVIRFSIGLAGFSVLLVSALIIILFVAALLDWDAVVLVVLTFIASMAALFASLVAFLYDINLALHALRLELKSVKPDLR